MSLWKSSYHGGHSGQFCDHAKGSLRETVESAIARGFSYYGMSEHCPRYTEDQIFKEEKDNGYTVEGLIAEFEAYSEEALKLQEEYGSRIHLLRGFETEYISEDYLEKMLKLRSEGKFDYIIGSVHHVREIVIDSSPASTEKAIRECGDIETFAIDYYRSISRMVEALQPEIVGHLDLIKKCLDESVILDSPVIRSQMEETLSVIKSAGSALDLNVYPFRKGKKEAYPAPWIIEMAKQEGIPFAFGDDSHSPDTVGVGIKEGREYLLANGVNEVAVFEKVGPSISKKMISLS